MTDRTSPNANEVAGRAETGTVPSARTHPGEESLNGLVEILLASQFSLLLRLNGKLQEKDLSYRHFSLLGCLQRRFLIMKEIAIKFHITPAGATELVDTLEKRQLVKRGPFPGNRTKIAVSLAPEGAALIGEVRQTIQELVAGAMAGEDSGQDGELDEICEHFRGLMGNEDSGTSADAPAEECPAWSI